MTNHDPADFDDLLLRAAAEVTKQGGERAGLLAALPGPVRRRIAEEFFLWQAHGGQREPPASAGAGGAWRTWLLLAGRGFGKTLAGAHWVAARARAHPKAAIALVGGGRDEVVNVMIEGPSGLIATARAEEPVRWAPTRGELRFASGATAFLYSASAPEKLRGPEHHFAWADELAKWPAAKGSARGRGENAWDNLMMGLRLGDWPRCIVTTTPRSNVQVRRVEGAARTVKTEGRTAQNVHLAAGVRAWLEETYGGTRLGRQELDGMLFGEAEGALILREVLEASRAEGPLHHPAPPDGPLPVPGRISGGSWSGWTRRLPRRGMPAGSWCAGWGRTGALMCWTMRASAGCRRRAGRGRWRRRRSAGARTGWWRRRTRAAIWWRACFGRPASRCR